ncbi:MAG: hypothetical protein VYB47_00675 [Candidatus Thermoplasmatota archaeon]|nr:hypothetical protein [Candidatus Thermoplasmatota archaeon]
MVDLASPVLGGFQESLDGAFGASVGWIAGHLILIGAVALVTLAIRNRDQIVNQSGFSRDTLVDVAATGAATLVLFAIFSNTFGWPQAPALTLGLVAALSLRWHVLIVE